MRIAAVVAIAAPLVGHVASALRHQDGVAAWCAGVQAVAVGMVVRGAWPRGAVGERWAGPAVAAVLLVGLAAGCSWSAQAGLLAVAGLSHAMLYGGLLAGFAASLRPGRIALVTQVARRVNPAFHAGMAPYTRGVTWAWCGLFAAELAASAVLLAAAPGWWRAFVGGWHVALVAALALAEHAVRRWRWGAQATGFVETVRGVRRMWAAGRR